MRNTDKQVDFWETLFADKSIWLTTNGIKRLNKHVDSTWFNETMIGKFVQLRSSIVIVSHKNIGFGHPWFRSNRSFPQLFLSCCKEYHAAIIKLPSGNKTWIAEKNIVLHDDFPTFLIFFLVDFPASHFWWHRRAFIKTCLQLLASKNDSANDWHIIARCFVLWTTAICRCMQRVTHGLTDLFKIEIFGIISTVCWTINLGDYGILNCTIMGIF